VKFSRALLGVATGLAAGYAVARAVEAIARWPHPIAGTDKDAAAYARARRALEVAATIRGTAAMLAFAYGPPGKAADRATLRLPPWVRPAALLGALSVASALVELPAAFVEGYALERRFGLSDQSKEAWLSEYVKSALLGTALTAFVATLFGTAVRRAPRLWPLLAGLGTLPLLVLANVIVPIYILPLFNAFDPVDGSLEERLRRLASRFGVGDAAILRMDMSRQTRKANAFVTGIGRTHRIVLGDTLIASFPENETEFVVAHELGHYVNRDTWRIIAVTEALAVVLFLTANAATPRKEREELRDRPILLVRFNALMIVAMQGLRPLLFAFSRAREWAADRFALAATGDAAAGASAFRRLRDQNLADEDPPLWYEIFFSSHPPLRARIAALETRPNGKSFTGARARDKFEAILIDPSSE
jgi:Zn-dependent protease with chaperone function